MPQFQPFRLMALNNAWANATLYAAIAGLSPEAFAAPRPGFFPSLAATLNHIHLVDLYYLDALEEGGLGLSLRGHPAKDTVAALAGAQAAVDLRLAQFCADLTEARLSETRVTQRPDGPVEESVGALLLHLFQHQVHHRGQAHTMVGDAGIAPPQLDDFFLNHGRAPSAQAYFSQG